MSADRDTGLLGIGELSRRVGVSEHVLRAWESRTGSSSRCVLPAGSGCTPTMTSAASAACSSTSGAASAPPKQLAWRSPTANRSPGHRRLRNAPEQSSREALRPAGRLAGRARRPRRASGTGGARSVVGRLHARHRAARRGPAIPPRGGQSLGGRRGSPSSKSTSPATSSEGGSARSPEGGAPARGRGLCWPARPANSTTSRC